MKEIILLSGKAQHGKDSSAKFIQEALGDRAIILHFADLLKMIAKKYLSWDGSKDPKGRTLLQWLGTDRVRKEMGWCGYWAERTCDFIEILSQKYEYFLIPDCRFPNEVTIPENRFKNYKVSLVRIVRKNFDNGLSKEQQQHPSEISLDNYTPDYIIESEGGLENLKINVDKFINEHFRENKI